MILIVTQQRLRSSNLDRLCLASLESFTDHRPADNLATEPPKISLAFFPPLISASPRLSCYAFCSFDRLCLPSHSSWRSDTTLTQKKGSKKV